MNPHTVVSASLVTSLVLWFPSMQACLRGDLDLAPAGLRYLAALAASRLAVGFLAGLASAYRAAQQSDAAGSEAASPPAPSTDASVAAPEPTAPHRRRSDRAAADDIDPDTLAA